MSLTETEKLHRMMVEVCPFRIGQRVTISPQCLYVDDFPGEWVIVGLRWEYKVGDGNRVSVEIASDDEIMNRWGSTDGFKLADIVPVTH